MAKNVNIKINADSKNAESGLNKVTSQLNKFSKSIKNSDVTKFNAALNLSKSATNFVTSALKNAIAVVKDLNDSYLKQAQAEKQLETAAKNNPYLNSTNVSSLKDYASQLQKISTVGDEELLPLMAQLASAGRTQAEIQAIMSAALDASASGAMSLDSAVTSLNKTFSGEAGTLSRTIPEVKNLTSEQLKNGDAVKLVGDRYKGMAEEVAKATGAGQQLKNTWGDFKENLGEGFNKAITPVQNFFNKIISGWNESISKKKEYAGVTTPELTENPVTSKDYQANIDALEKANEQLKKIGKSSSDITKQYQNDKKALEAERNSKLDEEDKKIQALSLEYENLRLKLNDASSTEKEDILENIAYYDAQIKQIENVKKSIEEDYAKPIDELKSKIKNVKKEQKALNDLFYSPELSGSKQAVADKIAENNKKIEASIKERDKLLAQENKNASTASEDEKNKKVLKYMSTYTDTVKQAEKELEIRKAAGEEISREEELQAGINTRISALLEMISSSEGLVTMNDDFVSGANGVISQIDDLKTELQELNNESTSLEIFKKYDDNDQTLLELQQDYEALIELQKQFRKGSEEWDAVEKAIRKCKGAIDEIKESKDVLDFSDVASKVQSVVDTIVDGLSRLNDSINSIAETAISQNEREADEELDNIKTQYEAGEISYEEYLDKKHELDKKAAQEEYRIKLAQWRMNLAMATAQAAQAVVAALADGSTSYVVRVMNAVSAGLLGAANVATVAGNKPVAPSFSTGGFLTGNSYSGDKIAFMGNAGEAILNPAEQRTFMQMANGEYKGGVNLSMPINIENYASDTVEVSATQDEHMLILTVNKIVKEGLASGTYSTELAQANNSINGDVYL